MRFDGGVSLFFRIGAQMGAGSLGIRARYQLPTGKHTQGSQTFSHRNVTCGDMNFRASRLREAQNFVGDSWIRLYFKLTKPRRRLGERRSSYRQEDSKKTPTASGSNRC
jgi:hypothetical protein